VLTKKILAAMVMCVMVAVVAVPAVIGEPTEIGPAEHVERYSGLGAPVNSATVVEYTMDMSGEFQIKIDWYGLSAVKIEIYDVTDGSEIILLSERIRADKLGSTAYTSNVSVMAGNTYKVVAIPGGGPGKGDYAEITPLLWPPLPKPPVADFTATVDDLTVTLDASASYDPDGMIVSWEWDLGDGMTAIGETVVHTYADYGTYTVTLTVTDDMGYASSLPKDVALIPISGKSMTYTIYAMGETYVKSTDPADMGRRSTTPGWNSWQPLRNSGYGEAQITMDYPYVLGWPVYSPNTSPDVDGGFAATTFYRMNIDIAELDTIGTAAGMDPLFVPHDMDVSYWGGAPFEERNTWDGGTIGLNLYGTYLTTDEISAMKFGTDWRNTYYSIISRIMPNIADDGWWFELHGTMTFDVAASQKYLGLAGVGSLVDEFNVANAARDVDYSWYDDWAYESGPDGAGDAGIYDIYTAYDYSNDIRLVKLSVDPSSTATSLVLRMWSVAWGNEIYMMRLMEAAGIADKMQVYFDDISIVGEIGLTSADMNINYEATYHLTAWMDEGTMGPAWSLEATHVDYCGNDWKFHTKYVTPYNAYDPDQTDVKRMSYLPGTVNFGNEVSYWNAPQEWDLAAYETLIVQLPTGEFAGFTPVAGDDSMDITNLRVTGSADLGSCYPDLSSYYDAGSKTITLVGPMDFPTMVNSYGVLETGSPTFSIVVV